jgi:hypothetical protein
MKKVIKLTESDLQNIVNRVIQEQKNSFEPIDSQLKKIKPAKGGKYCFGKNKLQELKKNIGDRNLKLHLIKPGETLSDFASSSTDTNNIIEDNKFCDLSKMLRAGDVIIYSVLPSM